MKRILDLGTFEYGVKAKWSTLIVVCFFLGMLMFPAVAFAGNQVTRTWSGITRAQRTNATGNRFQLARLYARNNATNRVDARAWACTAPVHVNVFASQATVRPTSTNRQMNANANGLSARAAWKGSAGPTDMGIPVSASVTVMRR